MHEIVTSLRDAESRLRSQHEAALRAAKNLAAELHKVERAIDALLGKTKTTRKDKGDGLNGEEVVLYIERVLQSEGPLKEPDLRKKINEIAGKEGKSRKGLHFRFKKAIKDDRFNWNGARWELRDDPTTNF